ncbi:MAG: hypothetical protein U9O98_04475 [Asgard group archaeon]|nr:hypothetical protein [Asgard group archaeon]
MERAREGALELGYQYHLSKVLVEESENTLNITITIQNNGSAGFYYPLKIDVGINNDFSSVFSNKYDIQNFTLLPTEERDYTFEFMKESDITIQSVAVQLISPMTTIPIVLANNESKNNGEVEIYTDPNGETITNNSAINFIHILVASVLLTPIIVITKRKKNTRRMK